MFGTYRPLARLSSRIHVRKCVLVDLVKVFKLEEMNPGVCVHYHSNIYDLSMYRKTPGACCPWLSAITGQKIFSSSVAVHRCIMCDFLETLLEEFICFSIDYIKFAMFDRTCLPWLH